MTPSVHVDHILMDRELSLLGIGFILYWRFRFPFDTVFCISVDWPLLSTSRHRGYWMFDFNTVVRTHKTGIDYDFAPDAIVPMVVFSIKPCVQFLFEGYLVMDVLDMVNRYGK